MEALQASAKERTPQLLVLVLKNVFAPQGSETIGTETRLPRDCLSIGTTGFGWEFLVIGVGRCRGR
jgi:hypothetical protein